MKKFFAVILMLCTLACLISCEGGRVTEPDSSDEVVDIAASDGENLPPVALTLDAKRSIVCAGDTYTLARCVSGDVLFTGNCAPVYRDKDNLYKCVFLTAYMKTAAGITERGQVKTAGEWSRLFTDSQSWTDIVSLTIGYRFMAGLTSKGDVVTCGDNSYGKCDTQDIKCAVGIAAGRNHLAVLLSDGSVTVTGAYADAGEIGEWRNVKSITCGDCSIIGLNLDGDILTYNADIPGTWQGAESISACGSVICGIKDGAIVTNTVFADIPDTEGMASYSVSGCTIAVLYNDGTVTVSGDNDNLECDTAHWHTGAYVDENTGYVVGIGDKMSVEDAKALMESSFGEAVTAGADGAEYAHTGMTVKTKSGKKSGQILIYGDVTGDGVIDTDDSARIKQHIDGDKRLEGVYERAAHVLHRMENVFPVTSDDAAAVSAYETGYGVINQHVYNPYYASVAKYYRINRDTVGYIRVEGTRIDYPIMYGDGYYYHTRDIYKDYSGIGSIYSIHPSYKKNNVVIGHNARRSGRMFHGLHNIEDRGDDLRTFKNRIVYVTVFGEYSAWELYAAYETGPKEPVDTQLNNLNSMDDFTDEQIQAWIDSQIARSTSAIGVDDVTYEDELLTMYTCGDEYYSDSRSQSRLYLFFRRVG